MNFQRFGGAIAHNNRKFAVGIRRSGRRAGPDIPPDGAGRGLASAP